MDRASGRPRRCTRFAWTVRRLRGEEGLRQILLFRVWSSSSEIPHGRSGMDDREQLRQRFNHAFAQWKIELPVDAMSPGVVWLIVQQRWTIWTRFDTGAEDGRERLDYYAMHPMSDDRHVRLYADGEEEALPAMAAGYVIPKGATAAEREAAWAEHYARNRAVETLLEEKGFVMTDQAHVSAAINRHLQTHPDAERLRWTHALTPDGQVKDTMANPNDEEQRIVTLSVDLTDEDRDRLDKVLGCLTAAGDELRPSDVRLGLDKLSDVCALRRINSQCKNMRMPLTKAQVEKYAECYNGLPSNVPDPDGGSSRRLSALEADEWLSAQLERAVLEGMTQHALEAVATWKYRGGALRKLVKENPTRGIDVQEITKKSFHPATNEQLRIEMLMELRGVAWPMATTILHFVFPACYPIVDVRAMRTVRGPDPAIFDFERWEEYRELCLITANEYGLTNLRVLDRALWMYDYCHPGECPSCVDRHPYLRW